MADKSSKMYSKSPKLERDAEGDVKIKKAASEDKTQDEISAEEGAAPGEDGSSAEMGPEEAHMDEMKSMHKRHADEYEAMHKRHMNDVKEMYKRHQKHGKKEG